MTWRYRSSTVATSADPTRAARTTSDTSVRPIRRSANRSTSSAASRAALAPLDQVGSSADVVAKGAHSSSAAVRRGEVIGLGEHERRRDQLVIERDVLLERLAVAAIGAVEQCVDDGSVEDDHLPPLPPTRIASSGSDRADRDRAIGISS